MKRVISLLVVLVLFSTAFSAVEKQNEDENSLTLELSSYRRTLRVGQSANIKLKIAGQAINDITKHTEGIDLRHNQNPEFVHDFRFLAQKEGDFIIGPYKLSFNGVNLESNSIIIKVLPKWEGGFGTLFRVDCNEISLGESFELVMEICSKERNDFNISAKFNPELATIESYSNHYQTSIKDGEESHYFMKPWIITPKHKGDFLITKDFFRKFPDDIEPPDLKVKVK